MSIPSSLNSAVKPELLDSLDYKSMVSSLIKGKRKSVKIYPTESRTFGPGQIITFNLPTSGFLCVNSSTFNFLAQGVTTEDTDPTCRFNDSIECIINRLQVLLGDGTSVVENITDYNIISRFHQAYLLNDAYENSLGRVLSGYPYDDATGASWYAIGRNYAVNLTASGVFNYNLKYLPLAPLANISGYSKSLVIQIYLENNMQRCLNAPDGGNLGFYEVLDLFMQLDIIECPEYENKIMSEIKSGNRVVPIPYKSFNSWPNIMNDAIGNQTYPINDYKQFMQSVVTIFKDAEMENDNDFTNEMNLPTYLSEYQYIVGSRQYPEQSVVMSPNIYSSPAAVTELLKIFGNKLRKYDYGILVNDITNDDVKSPIDYSALGTTFCTFFDNEDFLNSNGLSLIDGIDTSSSPTAIVLKFKIDQSDGTVYNIYNFTQYMGFIVIDKNSVKIVN